MMRVGRTDTSKKHFLLQALQWMLFFVLILGCFLIETAGSYLKPLLLIPLALCISAHTGEVQSAAVGTICGLLLDVACGKLMGYNAVWMVLCCVAVSLLHSYILRERLLNMFWLTFFCTAIQGALNFLLYYAIWGHADVHLIYTGIILPEGLLTIACMVPLYFLVKGIARLCGNQRSYELEKTVVNNYQ